MIYTIGHFTIATSWSFLLLGFALDKAVLDAIIEPLLNGFWFYSLVYIWNTQPKQSLTRESRAKKFYKAS